MAARRRPRPRGVGSGAGAHQHRAQEPAESAGPLACADGHGRDLWLHLPSPSYLSRVEARGASIRLGDGRGRWYVLRGSMPLGFPSSVVHVVAPRDRRIRVYGWTATTDLALLPPELSGEKAKDGDP